jgi:hypothetical protein
MEESQSYFVRRQGHRDGPWSTAKLKSEIALQKLGKHHEISTDGMTWRRAGEFTDLFATDVPRKTLGKLSNAAPSGQVLSAPPGSAAAADWYYCVDGDRQVGPIPLPQLIDAVMKGECPLDTLVWKEGYGDWLPAEEVPEIMSVLNYSGHTPGSVTTATQVIQTAPPLQRAPKAIAALMIGLAAFFLSWVPFLGFGGIVAVFVGSLAIIDIRRSNGRQIGTAMAVCGMLLGLAGVLVAILILIGITAAVFMSS